MPDKPSVPADDASDAVHALLTDRLDILGRQLTAPSPLALGAESPAFFREVRTRALARKMMIASAGLVVLAVLIAALIALGAHGAEGDPAPGSEPPPLPAPLAPSLGVLSALNRSSIAGRSALGAEPAGVDVVLPPAAPHTPVAPITSAMRDGALGAP